MINTSKRDVVWNYLGYFFNMGINVILLPVMLHYLSIEEMALWYIMVSLSIFSSLFDTSFSPQLTRIITLAVSGCKIEKNGTSITFKDDKEKKQNVFIAYTACKVVYGLIAIAIFLSLVTLGSLYVIKTSSGLGKEYVLSVWIGYVVSICINLYFSYFNAVIKGVGRFEELNKSTIIAKAVQMVACITLLALNFSLYGVVASFLLSTIVYRLFLIKFVDIPKWLDIRDIKVPGKTRLLQVKKMLKKIWYNVWREGAVAVSRYLNSQGVILLSSAYLGATMTASLGLNVQILTIIAGVSGMLYNTMYPKLVECRVKNSKDNLLKLLSSSWFFYVIVFLVLAIIYVFLGNPILGLIKSEVILPLPTLLFVSLYFLLESNHSLFASYLSTENRLPYVPAYVISSFVVLLLIVVNHLIGFGKDSVFSILLPMFLVQLFYNNWKWPYMAISQLGVTPFDFMKSGKAYIIKEIKVAINKR